MFKKNRISPMAKLGKESTVRIYRNGIMALSLSRRDYHPDKDFDLVCREIKRLTGAKLTAITDDRATFRTIKRKVTITEGLYRQAFTSEITITR